MFLLVYADFRQIFLCVYADFHQMFELFLSPPVAVKSSSPYNSVVLP